MPITLLAAQKAAQDALTKGIIQTIIKDSPLLQTLPWVQVEGIGLKYWPEVSLLSAHWFAAEDDWGAQAQAAPTIPSKDATLAIVGGDIDIDNYNKRLRPNVADYEAGVIELKAKAIQYAIEDKLFNGNVSDPNNDYGCMTYAANTIDGLYTLIRGTTPIADQAPQEVYMAAPAAYPGNGGVLSLTKLDELLDAVKAGRPDCLVMSKRSRRSLNQLARAAGANPEVARTEFGTFIELFNGIPIYTSDFIPDNISVGTATDCSVIYALTFGESALAGVAAADFPDIISVKNVGDLEAKDASRVRVKAYVSLALFSPARVAMLTGVR